jgi:hypothetical protein
MFYIVKQSSIFISTTTLAPLIVVALVRFMMANRAWASSGERVNGPPSQEPGWLLHRYLPGPWPMSPPPPFQRYVM